ncbi:MAG TPA: MqnA/MqnD/SBP family protein, partial [Phycisphaerales bacterium]|nr:MqnA/MqnD/SBP family protein [Phycisphaerales bacterium]
PSILTAPFEISPVALDIESLNHRSLEADLEITAISCAQYPFVKHNYALTACGASLGEAYGPKLITNSSSLTLDDIAAGSGGAVAIPGARTSAYLALRILLENPNIPIIILPFREVIPAVLDGRARAGLVIHEAQLTFPDLNLRLLADLGKLWHDRFQLPLPLGANIIKRSLDGLHGSGTIRRLTSLLHQSVQYALANRAKGLAYAQLFAPESSSDLTDRFIDLYVNRLSLDFGPLGHRAIETFLSRAHELDLIPDPHPIDPVLVA